MDEIRVPLPKVGDWEATRRAIQLLSKRMRDFATQDLGVTDSPTFDDLTLTNPANIYDLSHDSFADFVANEHIDHSGVSVIAGTGLSGGGPITASVTLNCDITQYTDELAQDAVGGILDDGTVGNVVFSYDDATPLISATVQDGEINHNSLSNTHNLTTDIDHDSLSNTHNLTTDIDHNQLLNYAANRHFLQTDIINVSSALSTGLLKVTTGTGALSVITDNSTNWDTAHGWGDHSLAGYFVKATDDLDDILAGTTNVHLTTTLKGNYDDAYSHIASTGADHSYIDQNVTSTGTPTFNSINIPTTTSSVGIIKQNSNTVFHTYGTNNIFIGDGCGNFTSTASQCIGIGSALGNLTSGNNNIVLGHGAGAALTEGLDNVIVGIRSGEALTTGDYNVCVGRLSGAALKGADHNFALGNNALRNNVTGNGNVAIGTYAFRGSSGKSFTQSVAIGYSAGYVNEGNSNVFIGYESGVANTTGLQNLFLGHQSGKNVTTGSRNIMLGIAIEAKSATGDDQLSIGNIVRGDMAAKEVYLACPTALAADADLSNGEVTFAVDETNHELDIKVKYSDGTVKTGTVSLS